MKRLISTWALLLTVIGGAVAYGSGDSVSLASYCKLTPVADAQKFRIIYQAPAAEDVKVLLFDSKNQLMFSEVVKGTDGFVKIYDLSAMNEGDYTFELKSKSFSHREKVTIEEWSADNLVISAIKGKKVAVLGSSAESFSLKIVDQRGETLYSDGFSKNEVLNKLYNLQRVHGEKVSFILSKGGKVIREEIVKL